MHDVQTKLVRYIYLDVVDFTVKRSVEAQTDIVASLNGLVRQAHSSLPIAPERVIYLPTGDGLGIAITDESASYDVHILFALELLRLIHVYNDSASDQMRKFEVRVGLSQNSDNLITDINGSPNVAGHGINTAQRVMSVADASQLLVSQTVYDTLAHRELYMSSFRSYKATIKHGLTIPVFQFIDETHVGLSVSAPAQFQPPPKVESQISLYQAYYMGHALANASFVLSKLSAPGARYAVIVLLHFLAVDSVEFKTTSKYDRPTSRIYGEGKYPVDQVYKYYESLHFWVTCTLADHAEGLVRDCIKYFDSPFLAINEQGKERLQKDYPEIVLELAIENA